MTNNQIISSQPYAACRMCHLKFFYIQVFLSSGFNPPQGGPGQGGDVTAQDQEKVTCVSDTCYCCIPSCKVDNFHMDIVRWSSCHKPL